MSDVVRHYYDREVESEWERLDRPYRRFELESTLRLIGEHFPATGRIADIGGGPGRYTVELLRRGYAVTLADLSPAAIARASETLRREGLVAERLLAADACDLSALESASFDGGLLLGPMYHLVDPSHRSAALAEFQRILKPGSPGIAAFINPWGVLRSGLTEFPELYADHEAVAALLNDYAQVGAQDAFTEAAFVTPPEALRELETAGFEVITPRRGRRLRVGRSRPGGRARFLRPGCVRQRASSREGDLRSPGVPRQHGAPPRRRSPPRVKPRRSLRCTLTEVIEMIKQTTRLGAFAFILLLLLTSLGFAQGSPAPLGIVPTPTPTPTPLSVSIWTDKTTYYVGEHVTIYFNVNQPSFIYIYDLQPDGIVRLVFPNAYSQNNYRAAGTHVLPDGLYKFTVAPPYGVEQLQIFASPVPLGLNPTAYSEPYPMIGSNPSSAGAQIQVQIMGITPQPTWTSAWTSFVIQQQPTYTPPASSYPPSTTYPPTTIYGYPPFPGMPGMTWYWVNGGWYEGLPASGWYWYFGPDMQWHIRIRITFNFGN